MILAPDMMIAAYNDRQMTEAPLCQDTDIFTAVCADDGGLVVSAERRSRNDHYGIIRMKEKQSEVT